MLPWMKLDCFCFGCFCVETTELRVGIGKTGSTAEMKVVWTSESRNGWEPGSRGGIFMEELWWGEVSEFVWEERLEDEARHSWKGVQNGKPTGEVGSGNWQRGKLKKWLRDGSSQGRGEVEEGRLEQGWTRIWRWRRNRMGPRTVWIEKGWGNLTTVWKVRI